MNHFVGLTDRGALLGDAWALNEDLAFASLMQTHGIQLARVMRWDDFQIDQDEVGRIFRDSAPVYEGDE